MPLNSGRLDQSVINIIREIPFDNESAPDYPYQTKVQIYDSRCSGCGFARIEVRSHTNDVELRIFQRIEDAIDMAIRNDYKIVRSCEYPDDICHQNGKNIYPTITEIVSNTCEFWDEKRCEGEENPIDECLINETLKLLNDEIS